MNTIFSLISPQRVDINNESEQRIQWTLTETCDDDGPHGVTVTNDGRVIKCEVVGGRVHSVVALDLGDIDNKLRIGNLGHEQDEGELTTVEIKVGSCAATIGLS